MSNATHISAYAAAKLTNAALEEAGLSKRIPTQMMYNYTSAKLNAGKKPLIKFDAKKGGVEVADLQRWLATYIPKMVAKATVVVDEETDTVEA